MTLEAGAPPSGATMNDISPIGSQTYPHRQRIKDGDFAGLCKDMAAIGIRNVEMCSPGYAEFASLSNGKEVRRILGDHGLTCPSAPLRPALDSGPDSRK